MPRYRLTNKSVTGHYFQLHFVRLTLHLQPPFPLLPDVGEGELPRLLVELHRLVLLHAVRRLHPFHIVSIR